MVHSSDQNKLSTTFVLIGAGNLGSLVTQRLYQEGLQPVQIINRTLEKAKILGDKTGCSNYSSRIENIEDAGFILVSVNDDSIPAVLDQIAGTSMPVFHTSGSTDISVFSQDFPNCGVLYPLQSFSPGRELDFEEIPVFIEASNDGSYQLLQEVAQKLSEKVYSINSEDRLKIHISAVFASNFTNHFILLAKEYLSKNELPPEIIDPLIKETCLKAIEYGSRNSQTGPAVREDLKILHKHEEKLKNTPGLQKIYTFVSESIIRKKKEKEKGQ